MQGPDSSPLFRSRQAKKNGLSLPSLDPARAGWASLKLLDPAQIVTAVTASVQTQQYKQARELFEATKVSMHVIATLEFSAVCLSFVLRILQKAFFFC